VARRFSSRALHAAIHLQSRYQPALRGSSTISVPCQPNFSHSPYPPCCSCRPALSQHVEWTPNHQDGLTPRPKPNLVSSVTQYSSRSLHTVGRQIRFTMPTRAKEGAASASRIGAFDVICPSWSSIRQASHKGLHLGGPPLLFITTKTTRPIRQLIYDR
jgi:hypothetical protein